MKRILLILFICISCSKAYSTEEVQSWEGIWSNNSTINNERSLLSKIPFRTEYFSDFILIYNENPDRPINYEVKNEFGKVLINGIISKDSSAQIPISISDLLDNGIFTIVLTSSFFNDMVWSKFKK